MYIRTVAQFYEMQLKQKTNRAKGTAEQIINVKTCI